MNDDLKDSEAWAMLEAQRLSRLMRSDDRNAAMPSYVTSVNALAVLLSATFNLPCYRMLAERVQREHRETEHGGVRSEGCEACGWFDGAAYKATTGREFIDDFPELFSRRAHQSSGGQRGS